MRKKLLPTICMLCLALSMTGCKSYKGDLDEGNIACKIALEDIPQELIQMDEKFAGDIEIEVTVENPVTRMYYEFMLTSANGFVQEATLNPGTYEVKAIYTTPFHYEIDMLANQSELLVGPDKSNYVGVRVVNESKLTQQLSEMTASTEILTQDMFSRKVQWNGQVVDIMALKDMMNFSYNEPVNAYEEVTVGNASEKIAFRVLNETGESAHWRDCTVKGVIFSGCNVVLPQGTANGMAYRDVVHGETGTYGTPEAMTGSILLGLGMESMCAYYNDDVLGDKITVMSDTNGEYVKMIQYDFAVFE